MCHVDIFGTILRKLNTTTPLFAMRFTYDTSQMAALTIIACFWNTFHTAMVLYVPKGWMGS